jgi:hypothetical protein
MRGSEISKAPRVQVRRRWTWYLIVVLLVFVVLPVSFIFFMINLSSRRIREAEAEADRLDPGWRLVDLQAARAQIPDDENSALVVIETRRLMPAKWSNWIVTSPEGTEGKAVFDSLEELSPNQKLTEEQHNFLRAKLQEAAPALKFGIRLAGMPRGRYSINWSKDAVGTLMQDQQNAREVAALFRYDALVRADTGDLAGALASVQAVLNSGRSLGDEPIWVSGLIRMACRRVALSALEHALAQGQPDAAALAKLQHLLEDEAEQPLQLIAARANRAMMHQFLEVTEAEGFDRDAYQLKDSVLGSHFDDFMDRAKASRAHPHYLRYSTAYVEIAKLPAAEQRSQLRSLERPTVSLPTLLEALKRGDEPEKMALIFHTSLALLRSSIVALALERYRIAEGRWPDDLNVLVPRYLASVPIDPFDGQPLRYRRLQAPSMAGVVVFSVGNNGAYDGGTLDRNSTQTTLADICFRLWDLKDRHQQPKD